MTKKTILLYASCFLFLQMGCQSKEEVQILARVDNQNIYLVDYLNRLQDYGVVLSEQSPGEAVRLKQDILNELIQEKIMLMEAKRRRIIVTEGELEARLSLMSEGNVDELDEQLQESKQSMQAWKDKIKHSMLIDRAFLAITENVRVPNEKELAEYYKKNLEDFEVPKKYRVKQIIVKKEATAQKVLQEILEGKKFEELVEKYSIGPEKEQEGLLGWMELESFPKPLQKVIQKLRVGQDSSIVQTPFGFHIVELVSVKAKHHASFERVKEKIKNQIWAKKREQSFAVWKQDVFSKIKIKRNYGLLNKVHQG